MSQKTLNEWQTIGRFLETLSDEKLGELFREYIGEAGHGGWDGYESRDVTGIRRMLLDLIVYSNNRGDQ